MATRSRECKYGVLQVIGALLEAASCGRCGALAMNPVILSHHQTCEQLNRLFCLACVEHEFPIVCAKCGAETEDAMPVPDDLIAARDSTEVMCPLVACRSTVLVGAIIAHFKKCAKQMVRCCDITAELNLPWVGCWREVARAQAEKHVREMCGNRPVNCTFCAEPFLASAIANHQRSCLRRTKACAVCGQPVGLTNDGKKWDFDAHYVAFPGCLMSGGKSLEVLKDKTASLSARVATVEETASATCGKAGMCSAFEWAVVQFPSAMRDDKRAKPITSGVKFCAVDASSVLGIELAVHVTGQIRPGTFGPEYAISSSAMEVCDAENGIPAVRADDGAKCAMLVVSVACTSPLQHPIPPLSVSVWLKNVLHSVPVSTTILCGERKELELCTFAQAEAAAAFGGPENELVVSFGFVPLYRTVP